jgi:hypothetical protein
MFILMVISGLTMECKNNKSEHIKCSKHCNKESHNRESQCPVKEANVTEPARMPSLLKNPEVKGTPDIAREEIRKV